MAKSFDELSSQVTPAVRTAALVKAAEYQRRIEVGNMTVVRFQSDRFLPYPGEAAQINPDRHGRRLAEFVRGGLPRFGLEPGKINDEDWGWVVPIRHVEFGLWIGCGNVGDSADEFLCFIEPHTPTVWRWFRTIDTTAAIGRVRDALDQLLVETDDIKDVRWESA